MKVVVKPLNKNSWSGVTQYKNCHTSLAPYLTRTGRLYTGLTESDEKRLSDALRLDLSPVSIFWDTFHIKMSSDDLQLDTNDPYDELRYHFLKGHKRVANGLADRKASANFVIINELEEAKEANLKSQVKRKAIKELDKLTVTDMRKCLRLLGMNADDMNSEVAEYKLFDYVENNPEKFIEIWVDNENRDTEVLIEDAIAKNVIRKSKNIYRYGTDIIGHNMAETVSFLEDIKNNDIRTVILNEVNTK